MIVQIFRIIILSITLFFLLSDSPLTSQPASNWHEKSFFGLHYDLHPNAQDTELGAAVTEEHIRRELEKVQPDFVQYDCKGHPGYTGYPTKIGYPSPGIVKDALKVWRKVTKEMGIPLSVHYSGTWDDVAVKHHPEWSVIGPDGNPVAIRSGGGLICHNSDYLDEYMIPQMIEIIDEYDVDGFWVDGDCWASQPCWCERCRKKFTDKTGYARIPEKKGDPHWDEWLEMHREDFFDYVKKYCDAVHALKPTCLVCSNWNYSSRVPDEITVPLDYLSGDFPPAHGLEATGLEARFLDSREKTWDLMAWSFFWRGEGLLPMKPLAQLQQETALVLMNGGSFFVYNNPKRNGHLVGWHQDLLAEVAQFARRRQSICQASKSVPQVALLHSKNHYYSNNSPLFNLGQMTLPLEGALQALLENHYHVDVLNEETLLRRMNDYNFIVVAEQTHLPDLLKDRLKEYVRNGGHVLASGDFAAADFGDILGVERIGEPKDGTYFFPADGGVVTFRGPVQFVKRTAARSLAALYDGQELETDMLDTPAATAVPYGKGLIAAIHAPVFGYFAQNRYPRLRSFLGHMLNAAAPKQLVELEAPPFVDMTIRTKENTLLIHLLNRSSTNPIDRIAGAIEGVPEVGPLHLRIDLSEKPTRVQLAPDPKGMEWEWRNNTLVVSIKSLHIHSALVIEK